jgi:nucleoid DNA-binding protein
MAMTKAELVDIICEKTGVTRQESGEFLKQVFAIMKETLEKGEKIKKTMIQGLSLSFIAGQSTNN